MLWRALVVVAVSLAAPSPTWADGAGGYGRFDHDLALSIGVGGGGRIGAGESAAFALAEARIQWLYSAGLALAVAHAPELDRPWRGSAAVEVRPLFLLLFFRNGFSGDELVDHVLYGVGLEGGVAYDGERPAWLIGLGTEIPIVRDRARGLFLRLGARALVERSGWVGGHATGTGWELHAALQLHGGLATGAL